MIIVDLDNCISDDRWRVPLIHWSVEDKFLRYHPYHMASPGDPVGNLHILDCDPMEIAIITSRPAMYRWLATMWLSYHRIGYGVLLMREKADNHLPSPEVKRKALKKILDARPIETIKMAYDDRVDVVEMYKQEGIPAQVLAINTYEQKEWYGPDEKRG